MKGAARRNIYPAGCCGHREHTRRCPVSKRIVRVTLACVSSLAVFGLSGRTWHPAVTVQGVTAFHVAGYAAKNEALLHGVVADKNFSAA